MMMFSFYYTWINYFETNFKSYVVKFLISCMKGVYKTKDNVYLHIFLSPVHSFHVMLKQEFSFHDITDVISTRCITYFVMALILNVLPLITYFHVKNKHCTKH